jgi:molecular chaperone Hsp33
MISTMKLEEYALRAMTDDGAFRAIALCATKTAQAIIDVQKAAGLAAHLLGELVAGTILVRETMAPNYRVQGIVAGAKGEMILAADSFPDGGTRGLLRLPAGEKELCFRHLRKLQVMRTLATGEPQQGLVEVPSAGDMSQALMAYMTYSEQVATILAVGCVMQDEHVLAAGGYLVQLLPEVEREALGHMTERLASLRSIDELLLNTGADPANLMNILLHDIPYTELEKRPLGFNCRCSTARMLASLATIARKDIEEMIDEGAVLEINCDFCKKEYRISPSQLRGLLVKT